MKDASHFDRVGGEAIVHGVRESGEQHPASVAVDRWASLGGLPKQGEGGRQRGFEVVAKAGALFFLPREGRVDISGGEGSKPDVARHD